MVLSPDEIESEQLTVLPGVQIVTQTPLPPNAMLKPVWTARSLQVLLQIGVGPFVPITKESLMKKVRLGFVPSHRTFDEDGR
jgi:hypothetical protein